MTLYQHFALEGVALHRIGAGVEQIGVAAEDLAIPEQNYAAALARTSVEQADVDRIQSVLHRLPDATVPGRGAPLPFCQTRCHGVNAPGWPLVSFGAGWGRNSTYFVSRTRCGILHAAPQSRGRARHRSALRRRLSSAPLRNRSALRRARGTPLFSAARVLTHTPCPA